MAGRARRNRLQSPFAPHFVLKNDVMEGLSKCYLTGRTVKSLINKDNSES